ncbi:MAG: twin-arginine translocase TatA/TatE family subunit [Bacteroidetes bacterium]|nr:MAG: twin-arginine translocase TatA/TatE family subunit [Bacteroidota bacterium]
MTNHILLFIGGLGGGELLLIFFAILLLFGAQKLPELARGLGRSIQEFKSATKEMKEEIEEAGKELPKKSS